MGELEDRLADSDLSYALLHNPQKEFKEKDIKNVHAAVYGENDGADWYWIVELKDGRIFLVKGGCDYTGWDCRSHCECFVVASVMDAANLADSKRDYDDRKISKALVNQIEGKQPFGTIITNYSKK